LLLGSPTLNAARWHSDDPPATGELAEALRAFDADTTALGSQALRFVD
jgi:hypothetical protein